MDMLSMVVPMEVMEVMGREVMREERSVNEWPRLVSERLELDAVFGLYNATGQQ